jgi:hypothetical protein
MEKERDLTERHGGRQHLGEELRGCDRQQSLGASLPPFLRRSASRRPTSPKATVWPPWYSPPATATSGARPRARLARRGFLVVGAPRRREACACSSEGRSGRWYVRRAAAGGDKPARVSSWAHRFNDFTPSNRESRKSGGPRW